MIGFYRGWMWWGWPHDLIWMPIYPSPRPFISCAITLIRLRAYWRRLLRCRIRGNRRAWFGCQKRSN